MLHVLEAVRGGTSRHLRDVVEHTPGVDHHVAIPGPPADGSLPGGAPYDRAAVEALGRGAVLHRVGSRRVPWHPANAGGLAALAALIRRVRPDVVHGHSAVGGALARLAGRATGRPVVYTANGVATQIGYRLAERALGRITWRWVAVSPSEAALALRLGLTGPDRLVTIPNGIELEPPAAGPDVRARLGLAPGTPLVGTVARLVPQKAPADFVALAAAVPDAHFLLVGTGPLLPRVDAAVAAAGLGGRWHRIDHLDDAAAAIAQLDVYVLTSRFEGAPYTPLEAMRSGVPVVLTDVVGNRDAVEDGVSGLLVPPGDIAALAGAVRRIMGDPALRDALASAGRRRVAERFDVAAMGARLAALYASAPP